MAPRAAPASSALIIITIGASILLRGARRHRLGQELPVAAARSAGDDADPDRRRRAAAADRCGSSPALAAVVVGAPVVLRPHAAGARRWWPPRTTRWPPSWSASTPAAWSCSRFALCGSTRRARRHPDRADSPHPLSRSASCWGSRGSPQPSSAGSAPRPAPCSAGWCIGIAEAMSAGYLSSAYKDVVAFVIILAGAVRCGPSGLLGRAAAERV